MLTFFHGGPEQFCDGLSRRSFLKAGSLALGGLALPDLLRLQAQGAVTPGGRGKSVIMICLGGGPSHVDTYDLKPDAPSEIRGEFRPIKTNVPGMEISELLPRQARIADKFAVVRSATWQEPDHQRIEIFTGFPKRDRRPSFGSYVSRLAPRPNLELPKFVSLKGDDQEIAEAEQPLWVGAQHRAFVPDNRGLRTLELNRQVDLSRLKSRKELLTQLDTLRRDVDASGEMKAFDAFTGQALDMLTSGRTRRAFDLSDEKAETLDRYRSGGNKFMYSHSPSPVAWDWEAFVRARRLVEAGVPFVSMQVGLWDHHCADGLPTIFESYRSLLPLYDNCLSALITDLHERGLHEDVCVVVWGEFGRTPRLNKFGGRDHWPAAGCVLFAGGGLKMGQFVGATNSGGEYPVTRPYTPQNILATLYHVLGIDPSATLPDHNGRPQYLLDDRDPVKELI
ncbi:MAG TPA: DUF1501 domain-containing protein [Candidatus Angelobacter sp.]|nr:DUF1501 domain-containing protein [Candidatus Angelobacter sp.]